MPVIGCDGERGMEDWVAMYGVSFMQERVLPISLLDVLPFCSYFYLCYRFEFCSFSMLVKDSSEEVKGEAEE